MKDPGSQVASFGAGVLCALVAIPVILAACNGSPQEAETCGTAAVSSPSASPNLPTRTDSPGIAVPGISGLPVPVAVNPAGTPAEESNAPPAPSAKTAESRAVIAIEKAFPYPIGFAIYREPWSSFSNGDAIAIKAILGSQSHIEIGGEYAVLGAYTLSSMDEALLGLYVTAPGSAELETDPGQTMMIKRGSGRFILWYTAKYTGKPHVSFYPIGPKGNAAGGVYFVEAPLDESTLRAFANRGQVDIGELIFKNFLEREPSK
ncbi:MAG: hypothetical protein WCA95_13485 [Opitutaceae bacterium]|jgi:hypothetical protein